MTGWSLAEPKLQDDTASILGDLQRTITDDSKQARERIKKEFINFKQIVSQLELEKLDFIDRLENDKKTAITNLRTEHDGLKMAQQYAGKNIPDIVKKLFDLESSLNRLRNSLRSQKINIEIRGEGLSEFLKGYCIVSYGPPPDNQGIPLPNLIPRQKIPQQTAEILKSKLQEKSIIDEPRAKSPMLPGNSLDNFIRFVRTNKNTVHKPTLESDIPNDIMVEAKKYCTAKNKYILVNFYEIILNNLKEAKLLNNIRIGVESLTKLVFCVYMDELNERINVIKTDSLFYQDGIYKNISHFENIFRILGYDSKAQSWQLNLTAFNDVHYEPRIERLFCEMCVLIQESIQVERDISPNELTAYFMQLSSKSVVQNLPMPAKIASKTQPFEENTEIKPKSLPSEDENEDQYAFSELIVAIDSLQTQDEKFIATLNEANPENFLEFAKKCVNLPIKKKYQQIEMYHLIHSNLYNRKSIEDVRMGLIGVFKYAFCQYFNAESSEISILLYEDEPFKSMVVSRMINSEQIFLKMGYQLLQSGGGMQLNLAICDKNHAQTIIHIICEILIAIQELIQFPTTGHDSITYFDTNRQFAPGTNIACPPVQERVVKTAEHAIEHKPPHNPVLSSTAPTLPLNQGENIQQQYPAIGKVDQVQSQSFKPTPPRRNSAQVLSAASTERQGSGKIQIVPNQGTGQMPPNLPPPITGHSQNIIPPQNIGHSANIPQNTSQSRTIPPQNIIPQNTGHSQNIIPQNTGHSTNIPPQNTGHSTNIPPQNTGHSQNIIPQNTGHSTNIPPQNTGLSTNIPPQNTGHSQIIPQNTGHSTNIPPQNTGHSTNIPPQNTGHSQNIIPQNTGHSTNIPPQNTGHSQNIIPQNTGHSTNIPPQNTGLSTNIPPQNTGHSQNIIPQNTGHSTNIPPQNTGLSTNFIPQNTGHYQNLIPQNTGHSTNIPQNTSQPQNLPPSASLYENTSPQNTGQLQPLQGKHPVLILGLTFRKLFENIHAFTLNSPIPNTLLEAAHSCVPLSARDKYSSFVICEVIISSLGNQKPIPEIRIGLEWLVKFCISIYLKIVDTEVNIIKDSDGTFCKEILTRLTLGPQVFSILGYEYKTHISCYYLVQETFEKEDNLNRLVSMCCDCLIAVQDLTEYESIGPHKFIEFFQQFAEIPPTSLPIPAQQPRQYTGQEGDRYPGKQPNVYSSHQAMKPPTEGASAYQSFTQNNPQFSVPVHSQMPHPGVPNYSVNLNHDPYGQSVQPQYQSGLSCQPNVDRQIGIQQPDRRQISGQQQQQQQQQQWQCPHCTSYNSIKYTFCEVCFKSPDFKPDFQEVPSTPTQPTKQCPFCSSTNRMQDVNCANCGKSMIQAN